MRSRIRRLRRCCQITAAIAIAALVALPDIAFAGSAKSLDAMSEQELERFVQQLNETTNWRKYRRPGDPPDFVPGKPVKVMRGAGASVGRGGGSFRRSGLSNRRSSRSSRRSRNDTMAQDRGSSRSSRSSSSSRSSFGNNSGSSFNNGGSFDQ